MSAEVDFLGWLHAKLRELNTDESVFGDYIVGILNDDDDDGGAQNGDTDANGWSSEKRESLHEIISQIVEGDDEIAAIMNAIGQRWLEHNARTASGKPGGVNAATGIATVGAPKIDIETQLAKILEGQLSTVTAAKKKQPLSAEELRIRDQILAQYSQVEMDECDDDDDGGPPPAGFAAAGASGGGNGNGGASTTTSSTAAGANASSGPPGGLDVRVLIGGGGGGIVVDYDPLTERNTNALDVMQLAKEKREQARTDSKAKKDKDKEDR